jgi:hypothetical protein
MRRRHTAYAALLLAAALLAATAPARAELPDLAPCAAPAARQPIIEPGRERQIRALFAPHQAGAPLTDAPGAPIFRAIRTQHDAIDALLEAPDGRPLGALRLRARACEPDAPRTTASFALTLLAPDAAPDAERLAAAVTANDPGDFYSAFAAAPPSPAAAAAATAQLAAAPPEPAAPFNASQLALAVILALAALTLLLDAPALRRDLGLTGRPGLLTAAALAALTAAALALRLAADPTFLREAYALPNVHALTSPIRWQSPITDYPQGSDLMTALIGPLLAKNPYDAWFLAHVTYGTLTVLAAYALGTALTSRRRTGLITAALFALWPHHIRFSASESTHVAFVLWATVALALAALAARNGRLRTFAALTAATAAAVTTRPEAALFVPACALLALSHGPGVRRRLLSPARLAIVAAAAYLIVPTLLTILAAPSTQNFDPTAHHGEALSLHTLARLATALVIPSSGNAFFDLATTPPWLWPLTILGALAAYRAGLRGAALALSLLVLTYLALYARMDASITVWRWSRYHLSALPAVVALSAIGLETALTRAPRLAASPRRLIAAATAIAALGAALYWPAVRALPMDWQRELTWAIDLGRREPPLIEAPTRLVLPDNRRRFRDLSPRAITAALTANRLRREASVPIATALERLHLTSEDPPALYFEGLYCYLALAPGESFNPQCQAMHEAFTLTPLESITITEPPFLTAYAAIRPVGPLALTLYRVGPRRLPPETARALIPEPWPEDQDPPAGSSVIGAPTDPDLAPPVPPLE